jgi:TolB-like protein/DNA-binding SARP family transcriptional activator/Flp pilus assembly protein TadD
MAQRSPHRFSTLGSIALERDDGIAARSVLAQPKRVALLAYLRLSAGGDPVTRDSVLGTFWPEIPEERALNSLRQGIRFLRQSLGAHVVERTGDHLLHVPPDRLWCDATEFEHLAGLGRHDEAMELYGGPFLDGLPADGPHALQDWIERTRGELARQAERSTAELSESALRAGQSIAAADWARRLLELDPLSERGAALLIDAHVLAGDRIAALRVYEDYTQRVLRALDLPPSAELTARLEALRDEGPVGDVSDETPEGSAPPPPPDLTAEQLLAIEPLEPPAPPRRSPPAGLLFVTLMSLFLALIIALLIVVPQGWLPFLGRGSGTPWVGPGLPGDDESRPSVAVLPFTNLSADSASSFFVSGVHESVLVTLSKISALDVSALRAVRRYADTELTPAEIAVELGVSALMSGSVQRDADRVRIILELLDADTGRQMWSDAYDHTLDDVFGVQAEIALDVARSLRAVLTVGEEERISRRATDDIEALDHYMRGRQAYERLSLEAMNEAILHYEAAAAADPDFAPAWAGIGDALLQRVQFFGFPLQWADSALVLVERATRLDPDLPEAHKTLGFVHSVYGRWQAALDAAERALELRPAYADALNNAGWSRYYLGDLVRAERLIRRSFRLLPTVPQLRSNVGAIWVALGRLDEAEAWLDGVLAIDPGLTATRTWRTLVDLERADPEQAVERAEAYLVDEDAPAIARARAAYAALLARDIASAREHARLAVNASPGVDLMSERRIETILGFALIAGGSVEEGRAVVLEGIGAVNRAVALGADGWDPPWELAAAHAALGDAPEATRHLERAVELGFPHAALLRLDPTFDVLRAEPGFDALVVRIERRRERQREQSLGS